MYCIDKIELERFIKGSLEPERMLAIDKHVCECEKCKSAVQNLSGIRVFGIDLGTKLLNVQDCLEYEELSALVDGTLEVDKLKSAQAHVNSCELCSQDIAYIEQLRSHAELREKVSVRPGMTRQTVRKPFSIWKWAFAGTSVAIIAAVASTLGYIGSMPNMNNLVSNSNTPANVSIGHENAKPTPASANNPVPATVLTAEKNDPNISNAPKYAAILHDGNFQVIKDNGRLLLAKADGTNVSNSLEARIEASIAQKLRTGKIKPVRKVMLAMISTQMRGNDEYTPPATAPKLGNPLSKIIMSATPTFTWSKVDLAESYRLRVTDIAGNPVFDGITEKNSIKLDKPLHRGQTYIWQVGVRFSESDPWANSAAKRFAVLPQDDYTSIQDVKRRLPGSHLALGVAYESFGLYDEAAWEYRALRRDNPGSPLAFKLLSNVANGN